MSAPTERLPVAITLAARGLAIEVLQAFAAAGVESIVLKGPSIARWLYEDELRPYSDIDLFVKPASLDAAHRELEKLGFRPPEVSRLPFQRPRHSLPWSRPNIYRPSIDVHTHLWGALASPEEQWNLLADRAEDVEIGPVTARGLQREPLALQIALHAAHHGPRADKPARDLRRALEAEPGLAFWERVRDVAESLDATEALSAGLRTEAPGRVIVERLHLPAATSFSVVVRAEKDATGAAGVQQLLETRGWRARSGLILRTLFPYPAFMRARYPLAARSRGGLLVCYIARPLPLLGRLLLAGIPGWLRARRRIKR